MRSSEDLVSLESLCYYNSTLSTHYLFNFDEKAQWPKIPASGGLHASYRTLFNRNSDGTFVGNPSKENAPTTRAQITESSRP